MNFLCRLARRDGVARRREEMVRVQLRGRGIRDERVLAAMANIPRERFMPAGHERDAYLDAAMP
ncbi:MAG: hypothetical protein ABIP77_10430, partial [Candidatus Limnocylindrales bacterium]